MEKGDSLWSIANRFSTTVEDLRRLNNLTSDILQIGQVLIIKETEIPPTTTTIYTVQKGDSLWSIANKYNITVDELRSLNNLTTDILKIGQQLQVPVLENETPEIPTITYTVQKGDSLWKIANKYNVSVNDIINLNNLTSNILQVGQTLLLPTTQVPPTTEQTYTVKRGDSLWSIANRFNTTVEDLRRQNDLTTDILYIGQVLKIPSSNNFNTLDSDQISQVEIPNQTEIQNPQEIKLPSLEEEQEELADYTTIPQVNANNETQREELPTAVQEDKEEVSENTNKEEEYHVKKGDSLWLIAKKYNTTVTNLIDYNELESINLKINDILKVPTVNSSRDYYIVQSGDTLWSIASSHNLSFQELKQKNNLKNNSVTIGQKLIIK